MSFEEEQKKAQQAYAKRLAALKKKQAVEKKRINDRVLELFESAAQPALYTDLYKQACRELLEEREERSRKAKEARAAAPAGA